ncbi:MAG: Wadjet anti-phage system protein JetD domain-containing protein [Bacteroidota bacterium]
MINPAEIKTKAARKYKAFLVALVEGQPFFPLVITGNKRPSATLDTFKKELLALVNQSKEKRGFGYTIAYENRKTKLLGLQSLPTKITFESEADFLKFLQKEKEVNRFKVAVEHILATFPELRDWVLKYPLKVVANLGDWGGLLKVGEYFKNRPKPNLYIRELPIKIHTKFIERHKGILRELLDILTAETVLFNESQFEKRFHLKYSEPLVRFKVLDVQIAQQHFSGLTDLSISVSQFCQLELPIERVLIVENKTSLYTTLTLPLEEKTIAIFGKGFQISNIKKAEWLTKVAIYYWGDLDAQGFEILSQMRGYFPQAQSFLMDEVTFETFFEEDLGTPSKVTATLNLTESETILYQKLRAKNWRLEQEKIPLGYVRKRLEKITAT